MVIGFFEFSIDSKNPANAIKHTSKTVKFSKLKTVIPVFVGIVNKATNKIKNVFVKNKIEVLVILDTTRLPSLTTSGTLSNELSNKTTSDNPFAASVAELNEKLGKLDMMLKVIHDFCVELKISLFVSSLYGMQKEIAVDNFVKATVNFSLKVPFIVIDPIFNKSNFSISSGNIYTMANTLYTNINPKNEGAVLIRKKDFITKMIKK